MKWRDYLKDPVLRGFAAIEEGGWRILVRRGYEEWAMAGATGGQSGERVVGGGRAEHPVIELPDGGEAVVRQYRRGGLMRYINRDRYFIGHRAFEETRVTVHAAEAGVAAPEVIAAGERRTGFVYRAWIATRWIAAATDLASWLAGRTDAEVGTGLGKAGDQIGRMHAAGIAHPDLNLRNLLVVERPPERLEVHLIDFDRAALLPGPVHPLERARELRRLARSARKLGVPLDSGGWTALREGYGRGWPSDSLPPP